ncbi:MAG: DinB family protein [Planctomycetes bacterium]|nr:DinB family protein [Planctomycetota bacterium]MCB9934211.1 DinB family protein [Planctomycetota bacterium]
MAERYISAADAFIECVRDVRNGQMDFREGPDAWSPRDIAFHVADVDSMLGLRLRRILGEDYPQLSGLDTQASVRLYRRGRLHVELALDALSASCALNTALIEKLTPEDLTRKGRHAGGHDVTAADLAAFMGMHIEAHIKQLKRVLKAAAR